MQQNKFEMAEGRNLKYPEVDNKKLRILFLWYFNDLTNIAIVNYG